MPASSHELAGRKPGPSLLDDQTWPAEDAREADLLQRWASAYRAGRLRRVEDFLAMHTDLADDVSLSLRLIYEEACLREETGEQVGVEEFQNRFPQWSSELKMLWECHALLTQPALETAEPPSRFPDVGEMLGDLRVVAELDRGAVGRVYLATQPHLSDRPVVLKVTRIGGDEHLSLARLQHASIVPLYSMFHDMQRKLRVLCMPYLGGLSMARLLLKLSSIPVERRRGVDILQALDRGRTHPCRLGTDRGLARQVLTRSSYVDAICWMGAHLADALQHAHTRKLVHLDIKPSNVLIAADGQPMLLDFHLARPFLARDCRPEGPLGGTPQYMSPEQAAALQAVRSDLPLPMAVDARSDIYSLGATLYESLTGRALDVEQTGLPQLRRWNPQVPPGVEDIVRRCLATDPAVRYASAAALTADLRRHLLNLPLQGVPNRSLKERWTKWRRRRPYAVSVVALCTLLVAFSISSLVAVGQWRSGRSRLVAARELLQQRLYSQAIDQLREGLQHVRYLPTTAGLKEDLRREILLVHSAKLTDDLQDVVQHIHLLSGLELPPAHELPQVTARCQDLWAHRQQILDAAQAVGEPEIVEQVQRNLVVVAVFWSELAIAGSHGDTLAHREALRRLEEATDLLGDDPLLARQKRIHAEELGLADLALKLAKNEVKHPVQTAWQHFALGVSLTRARDFLAACEHLEVAIAKEPQAFWPHYYRGICAYHLGHFAEAEDEFSTCIALEPSQAKCYRCRAMIRSKLNKTALARQDLLQFDRLQRQVSTRPPRSIAAMK